MVGTEFFGCRGCWFEVNIQKLQLVCFGGMKVNVNVFIFRAYRVIESFGPLPTSPSETKDKHRDSQRTKAAGRMPEKENNLQENLKE